MTTFKLGINGFASRIDDDGVSRVSYAVTHPEFLKWVSEGNTPEPYVEPPPDPEVLKETAAKAAAKQNTKLQALADLSPAEVQAWVEANVKTLPDAKDLLATLAVAVSILAKQI